MNPATGMVEYTNYFEKGHIGTGHIALVAPNTLGFEMVVHTAGGAQEVEAGEGVASAPASPQKMYVEFEKKSDDAFVSRMYMGIDRRTEGAKPMMELSAYAGGGGAGEVPACERRRFRGSPRRRGGEEGDWTNLVPKRVTSVTRATPGVLG
ncbi:MAG: hypothetical protein KIT19_10155 [Phycisphaeraceae bacterium]|nr:hypothetical protein [Phycisphaeraceae bacterium]